MSENDTPTTPADEAVMVETVTVVTTEDSGLPQVPWWLIVGIGVLAIIISILALVWPNATLWLIALTFGVLLVVLGIENLAAAFGASGSSGGARIFFGLLGLLAIAAGVILIIHPEESLRTAAWVLGLWFAISGAVQLVQAFSSPVGRGFNILFGLIGLVAGVIVLINPGVGIATLILIVSISFMIRGAVAIAVGLTVKKAQDSAAV